MTKINSQCKSISGILAFVFLLASFAPLALAQVAAQSAPPTDMRKAAEAPGDAIAAVPVEQPMEQVDAEPLQVGDATQALLAWQRSGEIASSTPRPIAGEVAVRSYTRYLKSFEYPIPERFTSSMKKASSSTGTQ